MAHGYLTPDSIPATMTRRWICFPDEQLILAAVNGALLELTFPYNWEQYGAITPDEITAALLPLVLDFQATLAACMPLIHQPTLLWDVKAQDTDGGTFTLGAWRIRDLNTIEGSLDNGVALVSNVFTLPAGRWLVKWSCPAYECGQHQSRLWDVTGSSVVKYGASAQGGSSTDAQQRSEGNWSALINTANEFRIEHRSTGTKATTGFGVAANLAEERYTFVEIYPIS